MELSGILDTDNSVHLFTLNLVFQPRINQALCQFTETFNHQNVRIEKKLFAIPNVAYHMMQPQNHLSNGKSYDFEYYGDDPDGPTPLDSDNNVVVEEIDLGQPRGRGGGTPMWSGRGCSSEILNLTPKRDQSGRGQSLCRPLKETSL